MKTHTEVILQYKDVEGTKNAETDQEMERQRTWL